MASTLRQLQQCPECRNEYGSGASSQHRFPTSCRWCFHTVCNLCVQAMIPKSKKTKDAGKVCCMKCGKGGAFHINAPAAHPLSCQLMAQIKLLKEENDRLKRSKGLPSFQDNLLLPSRSRDVSVSSGEEERQVERPCHDVHAPSTEMWSPKRQSVAVPPRRDESTDYPPNTAVYYGQRWGRIKSCTTKTIYALRYGDGDLQWVSYNQMLKLVYAAKAKLNNGAGPLLCDMDGSDEFDFVGEDIYREFGDMGVYWGKVVKRETKRTYNVVFEGGRREQSQSISHEQVEQWVRAASEHHSSSQRKQSATAAVAQSDETKGKPKSPSSNPRKKPPPKRGAGEALDASNAGAPLHKKQARQAADTGSAVPSLKSKSQSANPSPKPRTNDDKTTRKKPQQKQGARGDLAGSPLPKKRTTQAADSQPTMCSLRSKGQLKDTPSDPRANQVKEALKKPPQKEDAGEDTSNSGKSFLKKQTTQAADDPPAIRLLRSKGQLRNPSLDTSADRDKETRRKLPKKQRVGDALGASNAKASLGKKQAKPAADDTPAMCSLRSKGPLKNPSSDTSPNEIKGIRKRPPQKQDAVEDLERGSSSYPSLRKKQTLQATDDQPPMRSLRSKGQSKHRSSEPRENEDKGTCKKPPQKQGTGSSNSGASTSVKQAAQAADDRPSLRSLRSKGQFKNSSSHPRANGDKGTRKTTPQKQDIGKRLSASNTQASLSKKQATQAADARLERPLLRSKSQSNSASSKPRASEDKATPKKSPQKWATSKALVASEGRARSRNNQTAPAEADARPSVPVLRSKPQLKDSPSIHRKHEKKSTHKRPSQKRGAAEALGASDSITTLSRKKTRRSTRDVQIKETTTAKVPATRRKPAKQQNSNATKTAKVSAASCDQTKEQPTDALGNETSAASSCLDEISIGEDFKLSASALGMGWKNGFDKYVSATKLPPKFRDILALMDALFLVAKGEKGFVKALWEKKVKTGQAHGEELRKIMRGLKEEKPGCMRWHVKGSPYVPTTKEDLADFIELLMGLEMSPKLQSPEERRRGKKKGTSRSTAKPIAVALVSIGNSLALPATSRGTGWEGFKVLISKQNLPTQLREVFLLMDFFFPVAKGEETFVFSLYDKSNKAGNAIVKALWRLKRKKPKVAGLNWHKPTTPYIPTTKRDLAAFMKLLMGMDMAPNLAMP